MRSASVIYAAVAVLLLLLMMCMVEIRVQNSHRSRVALAIVVVVGVVTHVGSGSRQTEAHSARRQHRPYPRDKFDCRQTFGHMQYCSIWARGVWVECVVSVGQR